MVLPVIGGLIGSALAGGGALAMSPLLASAIGSGIGAFAETGDPMDALMAGGIGYAGGSLLGGMAGKAASNMSPMAGYGPGVSYAPPSGGIAGLKGMLGNPEVIQGGIGALASGMAMPQNYNYGTTQGGEGGGARQAPAPGRSLRKLPSPYKGSREYDYKVQPNYGLQDGGAVPDEKSIIQDAVAAIKGQHPEPEMALGRFLQTYGEEALRQLVSAVRNGDMEGGRADGTVPGPNMQGDMVPATNTTDGTDILLESGEFVMPNEAVAAIGGGDHNRGTDVLYALKDQLTA